MLTCCPACRTCFRITEAQLAVAQGKVRCGKCKTVFNARQHLQPAPGQTPAASSVQPAPDTTPDEQTGHIDLFRAPASEPGSSTADTGLPATGPGPAPTDTPPAETDHDAATPATSPLEQDDQPGGIPFETEETAPEPVVEPEPESEPDSGPEAESEPESESEPATVEIPMPDLEAPETAATTGTPADTDDIEPEETEEPRTASDSSRYQYNSFDDDILSDRELDDILAEMNQQLSLAIDDEPASGTDESVIPDDEDQPATGRFGTSDNDELGDAIDSLFDDLEEDAEPLARDQSGPGEAETDTAIEPASQPTTTDGAEATSDTTETVEDEEQFAPAQEEPAIAADRESDVGESVPFHLRESLAVEPPKPRSKLALLGGSLLILLLLGALVLQLALFRPLDVARLLPQSQPYLEQLCQRLPCYFEPRRAPDQIRLLNRDVRAHPEQDGVLLITATLVNQADFAQSYPDLRVTLFDLSGNPVAQRRFTPDDYLGQLNSPFMLMQPQTPLQIKLEVVDPGANAVNFEFDFL